MSTTIGNNKEACKLYKARGRLEQNKKHNINRATRQASRAAARIARRIKAGKPVHSRHTTKLTMCSDGSWRNLGNTNQGRKWAYSVGDQYREWLTPIDRATGEALQR